MERLELETDEGVKVEFFTKVKGLADIEECQPKPTKAFMPDWWKQMPHPKDVNSKDTAVPQYKNVKTCPSFPDYFSMGFVLPMWADTVLKFSEKEGRWSWTCGNGDSPFTIDFHGQEQFLQHAPAKFQGTKASLVFKFISPWHVRTPQGYSVLQLPMYYHFNNDFSVMPGVIDTDVYHFMNQQVMYHGDGKEVFIPRGTPLVQYVPIRREKYEVESKYVDTKFEKELDRLKLEVESSFHTPYRKLQREAKKK